MKSIAGWWKRILEKNDNDMKKILLIATGGTIEATIKLIESLGGEVVKVLFLMELAGLKGRERLAGYDVDAVVTYEGK